MTTQLTFIRKSLLEITATITPASGSSQPSTVRVQLQFPTLSGTLSTASVSLTNSNGTWTGTWDSSAAGQGTVYWAAYTEGAVQAATQGQFEISANAANTV